MRRSDPTPTRHELLRDERGHAWCVLTDFCERCGVSNASVTDLNLACWGDEKILPVTPRIARRRILKHVEQKYGKNVTMCVPAYLLRFRRKLRALGQRRLLRDGAEVRLLVAAVDQTLEEAAQATRTLIESAERRLRAKVGPTAAEATADWGSVYTVPDENTPENGWLRVELDAMYARTDPVYGPEPTEPQSPPEPEPA